MVPFERKVGASIQFPTAEVCLTLVCAELFSLILDQKIHAYQTI